MAEAPAEEDAGSDPRPDAATLEARMGEVGTAVMGGHQEEALRLGVPLLEEVAADGSPDQHELLLAWLAAAYVDAGRVPESLDMCERTLAQCPDRPSGARAAALCISGVIRAREGHEKEGLDRLRAAIRTVTDPRLPPHELLPTLLNLGCGTANVGLYHAAEDLFARCEPMLATAPPPLRAFHGECWAWLHAEWAIALRQEGNEEESRAHVQRVLTLCGDMQPAAGAMFGPEQGAAPEAEPDDALHIGADALNALACAWDDRAEEAVKILDRLPADLLPRVRYDPALAAALARAEAAWKLDDLPGATAAAREAAALADRSRAERWQAEAYYVLAEAGRADGDAAVASAAQERLEALLDDLAWQQRLRDVQLTGGEGVVATS